MNLDAGRGNVAGIVLLVIGLFVYLMARVYSDMMAIWAISSVGRALRLHRGCRRFEPVIAHHLF